MPAQRPLRLAPEWDDRFTRMVVLSAVLHVAAIAAMLWFLVGRGGPAPLPMVAYTVEITDPSALGGRMPSGQPGQPLTGGPAPPPAPEPHPEAEQAPKGEVAKAPEPKPQPEAKPPAPEPPPAETKPEPKPEAKPEQPPPTEPPKPPAPEEHEVHLAEKPKPPEPKPPEPKPVEKPPEPKPAPKPPEAKTPAKPEPKSEPAKTAAAKPAPPKPAPKAEAAGKSGTPAGQETHDDYAAAAERWRARAGKQGGGLGGADTGSGPIGSGGQGPGGGGQLVGLEFMAYRQQVINTVKARWTNVISRPGLVVTVAFEIGPEGDVSGVKIERSSGDAAYDASAARAVQRATPLPAPPARYMKEFHEFQIEFHSEEQGGQGAG
jgi:TonB family protein